MCVFIKGIAAIFFYLEIDSFFFYLILSIWNAMQGFKNRRLNCVLQVLAHLCALSVVLSMMVRRITKLIDIANTERRARTKSGTTRAVFSRKYLKYVSKG